MVRADRHIRNEENLPTFDWYEGKREKGANE